MWRRFVKENFWYVVVLGGVLIVSSVSVYAYLGTKNIATTRSQNAARSVDLSGAIAALPKVSSIQPAKTSGSADYVMTTRSDLMNNLASHYTPQSALWMYGLLPKYYAAISQQSNHSKVVQDARDSLRQTTDDLTHLKKIIEYMPSVDLSGKFADDPGLHERLQRTKKGIDEAIGYIQWSGLPHAQVLVAKLTKLNQNTLILTDQTKIPWAAELLEIQKIILSDITAQDIQQSDIEKQLQEVSASY